MNNEFYEHKKSDAVKWIIVFVLIGVLFAGMIALPCHVRSGQNRGNRRRRQGWKRQPVILKQQCTTRSLSL